MHSSTYLLISGHDEQAVRDVELGAAAADGQLPAARMAKLRQKSWQMRF